MGKTRKSQRGGRRRSVSTSSSSSSSSTSTSSSDRSRGYRRSRSRHADRYYDKRPDVRMFSVYQPGYGGVPMNGVYPIQSGMMPNAMMPQMPNGMMPPYGAPPAAMTQPGMMHTHQMQPPMYPYQNGMMNWPCQGSQIGAPPMQPSVPPTPVFQFQISPGKNAPGRK